MSVFVGGVTPAYELQIREVINNRILTTGKITSVIEKWWKPHRNMHSLADYILPGAPTRGGEMASWVLFMANTGRIKFTTMQGYVWALCTWHFNRFGAAGDPCTGVADWSSFMSALKVQTWVDSVVEPRQMIPFMLLVRTLKVLDWDNRKDVALGCLMLMMYYTMSRSETPLPSSKNKFDDGKHVRRCDVRLLQDMYVEWGFGSVKQNRRVDKDPNTRDWKPVGECSGIMSMRLWFDRYVSMSNWEREDQPFFYDENGPLLYYKMLQFMRECMARVDGITPEMALRYGFHGLRVLGYNCWRAASGEEVAILQGGWGSDAHRTYSREMLAKVLGMAAKGAIYAAEHSLPAMPLDANLPPLPTPTRPPPQRVVDDHVFTDAGPSAPAPAPATAPSSGSSCKRNKAGKFLPRGALALPHVTTKCSWETFSFKGKTYRTLCDLWAAADKEKGSFVSSLPNYSF